MTKPSQPHPIDPDRDKRILNKLRTTMDPQGWIEDDRIANATRVPLEYVRSALRRFETDWIVETATLSSGIKRWRLRP